MVRGDETAYREFYDSYFHRLLGYLLVVTGGREDAAKEALQATLVRVVRHIKSFHSEEAFWSWLTVLARSCVIDEHRKQTRYLSFLGRLFSSEQVAAQPTAEDSDEQLIAALEANLASLSADERDLIERKYYARQSVKEIALALGATDKAIELRLARARRKLKDLVLAELRHE
jgi:RNA polymerase sigma-70 factor, ECF subfamily